jgi:hypothetical protein
MGVKPLWKAFANNSRQERNQDHPLDPLAPVKISAEAGCSTLILSARYLSDSENDNLSVSSVLLHSTMRLDNFVQAEDFADLHRHLARLNLLDQII